MHTQAVDLLESGVGVAACPEVLAGLAIPRVPAEICGGDGADVLEGRARVRNAAGADVTQAFLEGAQKFCDFVQSKGAEEVWLKSKSPSCGVSKIYDGSFSGHLIDGCGVTCALLRKRGVAVKEID